MSEEGNALESCTRSEQHLEQAYVLEEEGKFEKAARECELAIHSAPDCAEAHNLRGIILESLGKPEEAIDAYREAARLDPEFSQAQENLREAKAEWKKRRKQEDKGDGPIAGFWRRGFAAIIDFCLLMLVCIVVAALFRNWAFSLGPWGRPIGMSLVLLYLGIGNSAYLSGQTIGKRLLKIAVVRSDGGYLTMGQAFWRASIFSVAHLVAGWDLPLFRQPVVSVIATSLNVGIGLTLFYGGIFNRPTRQGIHDLLAGSRVVLASSIGSKVDIPETPPIHRRVMLGLLVVGLLIGVGDLFVGRVAVAIGLIEANNWREMDQLEEQFLEESDVYSINLGQTRMATVGNPDTVEILTVEIWVKRPCTSNWQYCEEMAREVARYTLDNLDSIDGFAAMQVKVTNRFDLGLATGYIGNEVGFEIDEWRYILQEPHN
jgi:uncharacterized RDD family membrane protein YckC